MSMHGVFADQKKITSLIFNRCKITDSAQKPMLLGTFLFCSKQAHAKWKEKTNSELFSFPSRLSLRPDSLSLCSYSKQFSGSIIAAGWAQARRALLKTVLRCFLKLVSLSFFKVSQSFNSHLMANINRVSPYINQPKAEQ